MTIKEIEIEYETFFEKYKPVRNTIVNGAPIDGYMFETFGSELGELKNKANKSKINGKNGYHVWTVVDGEGCKLYLLNGWHICNRLGYVYTKVAWKQDEDIVVEI